MGSAGERDDSRHALLSKARPVQQTSVEAFVGHRHESRDRPSPPRSEFGTYQVKELEVDSALTDCSLPSRCWSLNPYTGCSHDCAYCYVPDVAHLERGNWGDYVVAKTNLPRKLEHELKTKPRRSVFLSSATDPYQPAEDRHRITRRSLELLVREGWPVLILTRSPLVERDLDLLTQLEDVAVGMSIPTIDDEARQVLEPTAPPIEGRLNAISALADAGLEPFVNVAPAYPLTNGIRPDEVAEAIADAGAAEVFLSRWRYLDDVVPVLADRVDGSIYGDFVDAVQDESYYDRLLASLQGAFRRAGIPLRRM
ncbi:hypothetical protein BRD56_10915 [Thermoplasmatales archaeon SW_10_69_26]|nr:MAG: hypothetical protein BRD56_10915 [Thermoplasmatales archaeon SW_10_69_26]